MNMKRWLDLWLLLAPDGANGGDSGDEDESAVRDAGFAGLVARYKDDATGLAKDLYSDLYKLRRKNESLRSKVADLENKVPKEGGKALTPEEAQQFAAYQALGTPEVVKQAIEERGSLQGRLDTMEREGVLTKVATLAGYNVEVLKDADALTERNSGKKPTFLIKEIERDGKKVETPYIRVGDEEKPLTEYAQGNWGRLLPSLTQGSGGNSQTRSSGQAYPPQYQGSGGGSKPQTPKGQTETTLSNKYPKPSKET